MAETGAGDVSNLAGVGPKIAEALKEAGFNTIADIRNSTLDELVAVEGIGKKKAEAILAAAVDEQDTP